MLGYLHTLAENSVEAVMAYHSLEYLPKVKFKVVKEILRTCKDGSIIEIGIPYMVVLS